MRGARVLRAVEGVFLRLDRRVETLLPHRLNPLAHTGAIAFLTLLVATVSGVVLLLWYVPTLHSAHSSVSAMSPLSLAGLMRALHRYSSDACMLFTLAHGLRLLAARRFAGARWLAWVTGVGLLGILWLVGWSGYWLVWDERARHVAVGTAKLLDLVPIFADPLSRSFLADISVNPLLFFIVFFFHMLVPLAGAVVLWLHLARVSRSQWLTARSVMGWSAAAMLLLSALLPADTGPAAHMTAAPRPFAMDVWYLLPLWFTDRWSGGGLWLLTIGAGVLAMSLPWLLARGAAAVVTVDLSRCNGCTLCEQDCPYGAINMVARTDGRAFSSQAEVNPARCVGCGICAGACTPAGIFLPSAPPDAVRACINAWLESPPAAGEPPLVAFLCAESAAGELTITGSGGACRQLPGYHAVAVPCAGWVHPLMAERALRRGAKGVLIVSCAGSCRYREGTQWTALRLANRRKPGFRSQNFDRRRVRLLQLDFTQTAMLAREAAAFRSEMEALPHAAPVPTTAAVERRPYFKLTLAGALLSGLCTATVAGLSAVPYAPPARSVPELVVSFKHPGNRESACHKPTAAELEALPVHMRPETICPRRRPPVRLQVRVDGQLLVDRAYPPRGLFGDGNSIAIEHLKVPAGVHAVAVAIGDTAGAHEWTFNDSRSIDFGSQERRVLLFDRVLGFSWH
ncbi:MAG: hydrogenase iron-sulfur subunit [Deltaproteobacteria bacterium]|nr:hydrogenase iron-sulfur subunit [Deltaproteobacteria bacterium]